MFMIDVLADDLTSASNLFSDYLIGLLPDPAITASIKRAPKTMIQKIVTSSSQSPASNSSQWHPRHQDSRRQYRTDRESNLSAAPEAYVSGRDKLNASRDQSPISSIISKGRSFIY